MLFALLAVMGRAEEVWVLLPEAKFMGHKVTRPVAEAKATVLAVARMTELGPEFPSQQEWNAVTVTEAELLAATRKKAAEWMAAVKLELVRDKKKVLRYAVLRSGAVPVSATVLAREFFEKFEPMFGARMRVVIPNRNTVFIFPDLTGDLREYGPMVLEAWRSGAPRVSLEVLEVSGNGLRAVGVFEEP